jgi:tetratricopeptide (TPR) repeat protein
MTVKELHDNLYDQNVQWSSKTIIKVYEANLDLITSVDLTNLADYDYSMRMTCDYAIALEISGYNKKSIVHLNHAIQLIENFPAYQEKNLFDLQYYELAIFHKARALFDSKKYKDSELLFKRLLQAFPDNDRYQNWNLNLINRRYNVIIRFSFGIMLTTLVLRTFISGKFAIFDRVSLQVLGLSLMFSVFCEIARRIVIWTQKNKFRKLENIKPK